MKALTQNQQGNAKITENIQAVNLPQNQLLDKNEKKMD